jgi:hypothetical protein
MSLIEIYYAELRYWVAELHERYFKLKSKIFFLAGDS